MKHSIIKDFKDWNRLIESTQYMREAADPNTPIETLLQQTDLEGLYQRILTTDDATAKALPNYAAVMEWWHQGGPDLNMWKTIFKAGGEAKKDKVNSARSMYYWLGGFATKGRTGESAGKANYIKNVEDFCTAVKNIAPSIVASLAKFTKPVEKTRYAGWNEAAQKADAVLAFITQVKAKGLNLSQAAARLLVPPGATDGSFSINQKPVDFKTYFAQADAAFKQGSDDTLTPNTYAYTSGNWILNGATGAPLSTITQNIQTLTAAMADPAKLSTYFTANNTLTPENKKTILDYINTKVAAYLEKRNKAIKPGQVALTADNAIKTATDLYISPKGSSLTLPPTVKQPSPEPIVISGSYPENPNGDWNSAAAKKSTQLFGDDKIQIEAGPIAEMTNGIKSYLDQIKEQGAQITGVKIWGYSSTSAVPSSYDPATKAPNPTAGYTTQKNEALAKDRLTSIKTALRQIFTQNGVADNLITEDTAQDRVTPNIGAAWTEADRTTFANRKTDAKVAQAYDDKFGKFKYAYARFEITYQMTKPFTTTTQPDPIPNSEWNVYINWIDETWTPPSISIPIPVIGIKPKSGGSQKNWGSTECPVF